MTDKTPADSSNSIPAGEPQAENVPLVRLTDEQVADINAAYSQGDIIPAGPPLVEDFNPKPASRAQRDLASSIFGSENDEENEFELILEEPPPDRHADDRGYDSRGPRMFPPADIGHHESVPTRHERNAQELAERREARDAIEMMDRVRAEGKKEYLVWVAAQIGGDPEQVELNRGGEPFIPMNQNIKIEAVGIPDQIGDAWYGTILVRHRYRTRTFECKPILVEVLSAVLAVEQLKD